MSPELPGKNIVLLGVGHTNSHVLKRWRMQPIPDARLVCISNFPWATYSGMLPGVLAGQYVPAEMQIDLVRLCRAAGALLLVDEPTALSVAERQLMFADRAPLPFEALSVGIGSCPSLQGVDWAVAADRIVAIKPMQTFLPRLDERLLQAASALPYRSLQIVVVGAGVSGCEIAMCLPAHLHALLPACAYEIVLVHAQAEILSGLESSTRRRILRLFEARGYKLITDDRAASCDVQGLLLSSGRRVAADVVIWATGAVGPPLLSQLGLPLDERGFLLTRRTLQTIADAPVFAVGDSGTMQDQPTPKSGVYAVRQGPVLWENLRRLCEGRPLREYRPQTNSLKLLNSGDGQAIGEYQGWSSRGAWVWKWKHRIDRNFVRTFQDYRLMDIATRTLPSSSQSKVMRCAGCGGKVSNRVLADVLRQLPHTSRAELRIGLEQPDDAAVLQLDAPSQLTVTTDFFQLPLEDAYLSGRIAALNALSDVWAMGATPIAALASAVIPSGSFAAQKRFLFELLSGGVAELQRADTALVGGHTIEGDTPLLGFTVIAQQLGHPVTSKGNLRPGDRLVLTKPLGTGVLLAGHMQAQCEADWMQTLVACLLTSNQSAAQFARKFDAKAVTDITGFGLAGHVIEMINASQVDAQLDVSQIQLLPGVDALLQRGIESTLAAANRDVEAQINVDPALGRLPNYAALFDPQTNGGLLIALGESEFLRARDEMALAKMTVIGQATTQAGEQPRLSCHPLIR